MSRVIKFRAWHTGMREMVDPYDGEYLSEITPLNRVIKGCQEDEHQILMQFTGLKDRNGVDIYEGDIVTDGYHEKYGRYKVAWNIIGCAWNFRSVDGRELVVIGNIYEHPKLLTPEDSTE